MSFMKTDAALLLAAIFVCLSGSARGNGYCQWTKDNIDDSRTLHCVDVERDILDSYLNIPLNGIDCGSKMNLKVSSIDLGKLSSETLKIHDYKCNPLEKVILSENSITIGSDRPLKSGDVIDLDLKGNKIDNLRFLESLPMLNTIDLQNNSLATIASDVPWPKATMTKVVLRSNNIERLIVTNLNTQELDLSNNQLVTLNDNVFAGKKDLTTLDLSSNKLKKLTKTSLAGLSGLKTLNLQDNSINEIAKETFQGLTKLEHLNLAGNAIQDMNTGIFNRLAATTLNIGKMTRWKEPKPGTFKTLGSVKKLYMAGNSFNALTGGSLEGLSAINVYSTCSHLWDDSLHVVDLCNLGIKTIGSGVLKDLSQHNNVISTSIVLSHNKLETLERGSFLGVKNVDLVALDGNYIDAISNDAFNELTFQTTLRDWRRHNTLNMSANNLIFLKAGMGMDKIHNVEVIILNHNEIVNVEANAFKGLRMRTLTQNALYLDNNKIKTLVKEAFADISDVTELVLSHNEIETIEEGTFSNTFMATSQAMLYPCILHLNNNKIRILTKNSFLGIFFLTNLDLSHNAIETMEAGAFNHLENLKHLDLSHNKIGQVKPAIFNALIKLEVLKLNGNHLTTLASNVFTGMSPLKELHLSENQISSIEDGAFNQTTIEWLDLSKNRLSSLNKNALANITNLLVLDLSDNSLPIITDALHLLWDLNVLNLAHNEIATIAMDAFVTQKKLQTLYLNDNRIASFQTGTFNNLKHLEHLNASNNNINVLQPGLLLAPKNLVYLYLDNNNLASFETKYVFEDNKNLHVTIHNNNLDCHFLSELFLKYSGQIVAEIPEVPSSENNVRGVNCGDAQTRAQTRASGAPPGVRFANPALLVTALAVVARSLYH